jgi:hypothetical protein
MKWKLLSLGAFLFFLFGACNKQENPEGMFLKFKSMTNEALLEKAQTNIDVTELRPLKLVLLQRSEQEASWLYIDSIIEASSTAWSSQSPALSLKVLEGG